MPRPVSAPRLPCNRSPIAPAVRWVAALVLAAGLSGCAGNQPKLDAARKHLAVDRNQDAIEALNGVHGAEASYLRSIAMTRAGLDAAAREQIETAVSGDTSNPRYKAVELRMRVLNREGDVDATARELVELCEPKMSDAGVALMAATGYGAQRKAANALTAFDTATSLADQIPEYLPEMLNMAMSMQDLKKAESLLEKMSRIDPEEDFVKRQRVLVLSAMGKSDESLKLASEMYERGEHGVEYAMLYAQALQAAPPGEEQQRRFEELTSRHATHVPLCILYGNYLARSGQLPRAVTLLTSLLPKLPPADRPALLPVLIGLPLEFGDAKLAEAQLLQHRTALNQPQLALYYEGRIRFLQKNYKEAARLLGIAAKSLREMREQQPQLLNETLTWLGRATFEANVDARLNRAIESAGRAGDLPADAPPPAPAAAKPPASGGGDDKAPAPSPPAATVTPTSSPGAR